MNTDSTFEYNCRGDLMNDYLWGDFKVIGDTIKFIYPDSMLIDKFIFENDTAIIMQFLEDRIYKPQGYLIGKKDRLYKINETGEVERKAYQKPWGRKKLFKRRGMKSVNFYLIPIED